MRKKARSLGFTNIITNNVNAKKVVKMAMALPLLPQENIRQGMQDIELYAAEHHLLADMMSFFNYVRRTWIEGKP